MPTLLPVSVQTWQHTNSSGARQGHPQPAGNRKSKTQSMYSTFDCNDNDKLIFHSFHIFIALRFLHLSKTIDWRLENIENGCDRNPDLYLDPPLCSPSIFVGIKTKSMSPRGELIPMALSTFHYSTSICQGEKERTTITLATGTLPEITALAP